MKTGKDLLIQNDIGNYRKSLGWPFLISFSFKLFGVNNYVPIYISAILGASTIVLIFFMTYTIFRDEKISLYSTLIFSVLPIHLKWSGSAETNVTSLFFIVFSITLMFLYYRLKRSRLMYLSLAVISFTCVIRPENYVLIPLFFIGRFIFSRKISKKELKHLLIGCLFVFLIVTPHFLRIAGWYSEHYDQTREDDYNNKLRKNWSLENLVENTKRYGHEIIKWDYLVYLIPLFAIFGLWSRFGAFSLTYVVFFWLFHFGTWHNELWIRDRMFMMFYLVIIVLAAKGIKELSTLFKGKYKQLFKLCSLVLILILTSFQIKGIVYGEAVDYVSLETQIIEKVEKELQGCTIAAAFPIAFESTTNLTAVGLEKLIDPKINTSNSCWLFFEDFYCIKDWSPEYYPICNEIKEIHNLSIYKNYSYGSATYYFHKVSSP